MEIYILQKTSTYSGRIFNCIIALALSFISQMWTCRRPTGILILKKFYSTPGVPEESKHETKREKYPSMLTLKAEIWLSSSHFLIIVWIYLHHIYKLGMWQFWFCMPTPTRLQYCWNQQMNAFWIFFWWYFHLKRWSSNLEEPLF